MGIKVDWNGREYDSREHCSITQTPKGFEIRSTIRGTYGTLIYHVDYFILTDNNWHTLSLKLSAVCNAVETVFELKSDGKGNWIMNDITAESFEGCLDIDIPLTPFTNTLPIRRLRLRTGETKEIAVIYIDVLENEISVKRQLYTKLSDTKYRYENIPNDFEADIIVDENGLVIDYPQLFYRTTN